MSEQKNNKDSLNSVEEILKIVKQGSTIYAYPIWLPSLNREVKFNELTTAQQIRLVKSILNSEAPSAEFATELNNVIKENCAEPIVIDDITILDKLMIALNTRINSIGELLVVEIENKKQEKIKATLNLKTIYDIARETVKNLEPRTLSDGVFNLECTTPTIATEMAVEMDLKNVIDKTENADANFYIENILISEIAKYITKISILQDNKPISIDWKNIKFSERIKLIGNFKPKLIKQIVDYINEVRTEIDKIEVVNFRIGEETYTRRLSVDGSFFMIS